jgi:hypothetical protein
LGFGDWKLGFGVWDLHIEGQAMDVGCWMLGVGVGTRGSRLNMQDVGVYGI